MNETKAVVVFLSQALMAMRLEGSRHKLDMFADRISKACSEPTLARAMEQLLAGVDADVARIEPQVVARAMAVAQSPKAHAALEWLREHTKIAAMLASLKDQKVLDEALESLELGETRGAGAVGQRTPYVIPITATCQTALAHGEDGKAGNATRFRRIGVMTNNGVVASLPYYSGNAVRGMMRDMLADHFLLSVGLTADRSKPAVALWFFHALYAGGCLEDRGDATKALSKILGDHGAIRGDGIRTFRNMLPALSLLGCALGNRILSGRAQFGDLRPRCREWGTGEIPVAELMDWEFLTRREDHEAHREHVGMIANTEVLRAGTVLDGGIDYDSTSTELERSALAMGVELFKARGVLGAEGRRGLGRVTLDVGCPLSSDLYEAHLRDNKSEVIGFLGDIGALPKELEL